MWRRPIGGGYAGVVVADGRVYTMDRQAEPERERVLCFAAATGEPLWAHAYDAPYAGLTYDSGPRAAPTVHDGRLYTLGAVGHVACLDAASGAVQWSFDAVARLQAVRPKWGFAAAPVVPQTAPPRVKRRFTPSGAFSTASSPPLSNVNNLPSITA